MFRMTLGASVIVAAGMALPGPREIETPRHPTHAVVVAPVRISPPLTREILWRPDIEKQSPFGFIPTVWTVRPQMLPGQWDVATILATDDPRTQWAAKRAAR